MNAITVTAYGSPGSFVRMVQENPAVAVDLLRACSATLHQLETDSDLEAVTRPDKYRDLVTMLREAVEAAGGAI